MMKEGVLGISIGFFSVVPGLYGGLFLFVALPVFFDGSTIFDDIGRYKNLLEIIPRY